MQHQKIKTKTKTKDDEKRWLMLVVSENGDGKLLWHGQTEVAPPHSYVGAN